MALNEVKFQTVGGGLGRRAAGEDHYSCIAMAAPMPGGFTGNIKEFRDLAAVEDAGITAANPDYAILHYQAKEFFRIAPGTALYICLSDKPNVILPALLAIGGKVRQIGLFGNKIDSGPIGELQEMCVSLENNFSFGVVCVYGFMDVGGFDSSALPDLGMELSLNVSVLLSGSGSGEGAALANATGMVIIPAVGAVLGALAKASVHESIAWVEKFNLSNGTELEVIRTHEGDDNPSYAMLDELNSKRYLVLRKHIGVAGTYLNDSHTAIAQTNDYAFLESSRTMGKVKRLVRAVLLPDLNSPLTVDAATGFLAPGTIKYFESKCERPLDQMQAAGEISGYGVYINPDQDVLATSELTIQIKIVPRGVARNITVSVGFSVTTSF